MTQYIDKSALVVEIERLAEVKPIDEFQPQVQNKIDWLSGKLFAINSLRVFLDTLEVKEVDLEKELIEWHKEHFKKDGTFIGMSGFYLTNNSQMDIAKHFFELGLKAKEE
jgi:hypothetical protein